jgi:hypothetical protein
MYNKFYEHFVTNTLFYFCSKVVFLLQFNSFSRLFHQLFVFRFFSFSLLYLFEAYFAKKCTQQITLRRNYLS